MPKLVTPIIFGILGKDVSFDIGFQAGVDFSKEGFCGLGVFSVHKLIIQ